MSHHLFNNVTIAERNVRTLVGISLIIDQLISPIVPVFLTTFMLLAMYLLFTALIAWDPLYAFIYGIMRLLKLGDSKQDRVNGMYA